MGQFERNGWLTFEEVVDPVDGRLLMRARLTAGGNARSGALGQYPRGRWLRSRRCMASGGRSR
jgi:hypothetical protein